MNTTTTTTSDEPAPLFKPFQWVPEQHQRGPYDMLQDVRDVVAGVSLVLEIVERSGLMHEVGDAPLVDNFDAGRLNRMAIAALHCVEGRLDTYFDFLAKPGMPHTETERNV